MNYHVHDEDDPYGKIDPSPEKIEKASGELETDEEYTLRQRILAWRRSGAVWDTVTQQYINPVQIPPIEESRAPRDHGWARPRIT